MGKATILSGEAMTLSTGQVLAGFQTAASGANGSNVFIRRMELGQSGTETLDQIRGEFALRNTSGTLTMTSATPIAYRSFAFTGASFLTGNTNILGGTARSAVNSSADSGGTYTSIFPFAFPNTAGYLFKPDDEEQLWVAPSTILVVRLLGTPVSLTGWTISLWLDENS